MKMKLKIIRIGKLSEQLKVKKFVIRFWEKEFSINTKRSKGGQRFYTHSEVEKLKTIKHLLYNQGFTIAGAKNFLKQNSNSNINVLAASKTNIIPKIINNNDMNQKNLNDEINALHKKLVKLKELL